MKIFPIYKKLGWDYLFYYTIDFLFLTQIKGISAADVVLKGTFYSLFIMILQIPSNIIVEFLGRKNSIVLANVLNCFYMVVIMLSKNLGDLIFAEFIEAMVFSIKDVTEPSLLNESIPPSRNKSKMFAKINAKGTSGYYIFNAISKLASGYLFAINGYIPMICSLIVLIVVTIISIGFIEPVKKKKPNINELLNKKQIKEIKEGFSYIIKSERLKALVLPSTAIVTLIIILRNYHVSLLEDLNVSSVMIGIISAIGCLVSSFASKRQEIFHQKLRNKSIFVISIMFSISSLIAGTMGLLAEKHIIFIFILISINMIYYFAQGTYYSIIDKYFRNFSNEKIDVKIFSAKNLFENFGRMIGGLMAAFLLSKISTAYCMIVIGIIFTIIYILLAKYMKTRVGLKPEEYSEEERKYDEQKQLKGDI